MPRAEYENLPSPLSWKMAQLHRTAHGLRPNPTEAVSHLIDAAELFLQLGAAVCVAALSRGKVSQTAGPFAEWCREEFIAKPLSMGHFATAWTRAAELLVDLGREEDRPFLPAAVYIHRDKRASQERRELLEAIGKLPNLRNRKKGHTFTLPASDALKLLAEWEPRLHAIYTAADFWTRDLRLCSVREVVGALVELVPLIGTASSEAVTSSICELAEPVLTGAVVALPAAVLEGTRVAVLGDCVSLAPLLLTHDGRLYLYQGRRGKSLTYLSADAKELDRADLVSELSLRLAPLLGASAVVPPEPEWANTLEGHELLSKAAAARRRVNADGFYKGTPANWADIEHELDVPRDFIGPKGTTISGSDLVDLLEQAVERAKRFECPVVSIVGHAGSGKTTALLRAGFDLWRRLGDRVCVLWNKVGTRLSTSDYQTASNHSQSDVICVLIDEAGNHHERLRALRRNAAHDQIPLMLVCAERQNLWPADIGDHVVLQNLSDSSIAALLQRLESRGALGRLADLDHAQRMEVIKSRLDRQLLVALRESTEGRSFDEILRDEYERIPSAAAQRAYASACLLHDAKAYLPAAAARVLVGAHSRGDEARLLNKPCQGVLVAHTTDLGRAYGARHALIAGVVCDEILRTHDLLDEALSDVIWALAAIGEQESQIEYVQRLLTNERVEKALKAGAILDRALDATADFGRHRGVLLSQMLHYDPAFWLRLYRKFDDVQLLRCGEAVHLRAAFLIRGDSGEADAIDACNRGIALLRQKSWPATRLLLRRAALLQAAGADGAGVVAAYEEAVAEVEDYGGDTLEAHYELARLYDADARSGDAMDACRRGLALRKSMVEYSSAFFFLACDVFLRSGDAASAIAAVRAGVEEANRLGASPAQLEERLIRLYGGSRDWVSAVVLVASAAAEHRVNLCASLGRSCSLSDAGVLEIDPELQRHLLVRGLWIYWPALAAGAVINRQLDNTITAVDTDHLLASAVGDGTCDLQSVHCLRTLISRSGPA